MKFLSDYQNDKQTAVFKQYGAFFAFSNKQFDEKMQNGIKYASLGAGLIAPIDNVSKLTQELDDIHQNAVKQDIKENGVKAIIHRELSNHECQITSDYSEVVTILACYDITESQINNEWSEFYQKCIDNDWF